MAADEFKIIAIEIPKIIDYDILAEFKSKVLDVTIQDAEVINKILSLDTSEIEIEDVSEEDLFHIG